MAKKANRANRKSVWRLQGCKDYKTGETHAPLNNHDPRVGIAKWKRKGKCRCEICAGHKRNTIAELEEHWTKWNYD